MVEILFNLIVLDAAKDMILKILGHTYRFLILAIIGTRKIHCWYDLHLTRGKRGHA